MTHTPRKRFGQNFLVDKHIIADIIAAIHPQRTDHIVEIGPGHGALTAALIASGAGIDAVEIDRDLAQELQQKFRTCKNFALHNADILKFSLQQLIDKRKSYKLRIIGNLPYNISTPLMFKLFAELENIHDLHFMLQKEVAERLTASPNTKAYGRMSIMAQYYCAMEIILHVPPQSFTPAPKVDSCVVRFTPHLQPTVSVTDHALLHNIVTHAFSHRRKTIANSMKDFITAEELLALHLEPQLRAENLRLSDYTNIANYISGNK